MESRDKKQTRSESRKTQTRRSESTDGFEATSGPGKEKHVRREKASDEVRHRPRRKVEFDDHVFPVEFHWKKLMHKRLHLSSEKRGMGEQRTLLRKYAIGHEEKSNSIIMCFMLSFSGKT